MYQSIATYETLSLLKSQKLIDLSLVFKKDYHQSIIV